MEIDGEVVEDSAWLRKKDDHAHINLAELDAAIRGISLAVNWGLKEIVLMSDSATVVKWLTNSITNLQTIKCNGMAELLVKRRIGIFKEMIETMNLSIKIRLIPSAQNKADALTRVPVKWKETRVNNSLVAAVNPTHLSTSQIEDIVKQVHDQHHFGVNRTAFFVHQKLPSVSKSIIRKVVKQCRECLSIDPSTEKIKRGILSKSETWSRLALDVTHYGNKKFLTIVDCGPSRFAIWKEINSEEATMITRNMEAVFRERGAPDEVLCDNGKSFRSVSFFDLCEKWAIRIHFRAAYQPSGNGIVERNHRTIKRISARANIHPLEAVFWYNAAPKSGEDQESCPANMIFKYKWKEKRKENFEEQPPTKESKFKVGDRVFVKLSGATCSTRWEEGEITRINSRWNVDVNGTPRHVSHIRQLPSNIDISSSSEDSSEEENETGESNDDENVPPMQSPPSPPSPPPPSRRYPLRVRRRPDRLIENC